MPTSQDAINLVKQAAAGHGNVVERPLAGNVRYPKVVIGASDVTTVRKSVSQDWCVVVFDIDAEFDNLRDVSPAYRTVDALRENFLKLGTNEIQLFPRRVDVRQEDEGSIMRWVLSFSLRWIE